MYEQRRTYGFWASTAWAVAAALAAGAVSFLAALLLPRLNLPDVLADQIILTLSSLVIIAVVLTAIAWRSIGFAPYLGLTRPRLWVIVVAVAGMIAIQVAGTWSGDYLGIGAKDSAWEVAEYRRLLASNAAIVLAIINVPLLAPLTEEILFRGFLYRGWAASRLGPAGAIMLASLLFGALHIQYSWHGLATVTVLGLWFGVVRWRSGSLVPSLIAHVFGNAMVSVAAAVAATSS
jgi:uncharacterized protein